MKIFVMWQASDTGGEVAWNEFGNRVAAEEFIAAVMSESRHDPVPASFLVIAGERLEIEARGGLPPYRIGLKG